jgi:hypothetical protein
MQHWLRDISSSSDPFGETFENMLRKSSVKQPDNRPVAVTLAQKRAREEHDLCTSHAPAQESRQETEASLNHSAESTTFPQAKTSLQVGRPIFVGNMQPFFFLFVKAFSGGVMLTAKLTRRRQKQAKMGLPLYKIPLIPAALEVAMVKEASRILLK